MMPRAVGPRVRRLVALAVVATAVGSACQFDSITVPKGRERPVVHAVLNPWSEDEVVLIERTLTGRVSVNADREYDRNDPIVSAGGIPIRGARVMLYTAAGDSAVAVEDARRRGDGIGQGVYRIGNSAVPRDPGSEALPALRIVPGGSYRLRITTSTGDTITGTTTLPQTQNVRPAENTRFFNRDTDTLRLFWEAVPREPRYMIRIESPWGPMFLFTDALEARLPGSLRNVFQQNVPSVFLPGFRSTVSVAAVDGNYFDYFRSASDPFTGSGLINRLVGAVGVFGSMAELYSYRMVVTAETDDPFEGWYERAPDQSGQDSPRAMKLYIESHAGAYTFLTGEFEGSPAVPSASLTGLRAGNQVSIAFMTFFTDVSDTSATFVGTVVGDSLIGTVRVGGIPVPARYGKTIRP